MALSSGSGVFRSAGVCADRNAAHASTSAQAAETRRRGGVLGDPTSPCLRASVARRCARYAPRMRLKIKRLDRTISLPAYGTDDAAGFDLAAAHDVVVPPGRIVLVRTGLIIEVP